MARVQALLFVCLAAGCSGGGCGDGDAEEAEAPEVEASAEAEVEPPVTPQSAPPALKVETDSSVVEGELRARVAHAQRHGAATGAFDCKEDMACLVRRGQECKHAVVRKLATKRGRVSATDYIVGGGEGVPEGHCFFREQIMGIDMVLDERMEKLAKRYGKAPAQMREEAQASLGELRRVGTDGFNCVYPQGRLDEVLLGLSGGPASRGTFDMAHCYRGEGECEDFALAEGCKAEPCKHGRRAFSCTRGEETLRCVTPPKGGASAGPDCRLDCRAGGKVQLVCAP